MQRSWSRFRFLLVHTFAYVLAYVFALFVRLCLCLCFCFCLFTFIAHPFSVLCFNFFFFLLSVWQVQRVFDLIVCSVAQFEVINIETEVRWRQTAASISSSLHPSPCPIHNLSVCALIYSTQIYSHFRRRRHRCCCCKEIVTRSTECRYLHESPRELA